MKNKKLDIIVYSVDYAELEQTREAFNRLRLADKEFNYPFGFGKLQMHGPFKTDAGFQVYSSVHMYTDTYMKKCAYSHSPRLRSICAGWVKHFFPEQANYFSNVCLQADQIKMNILQRNVAGGLNG
jgi:hypothetical protein